MFQSNEIGLNVPKELQNKDILFRIQGEKKPDPKVERIRSFYVQVYSHQILINYKSEQVYVPIRLLYEVLHTRGGLTKTLPMYVTLDPTTFVDVDWKPLSYSGPNVWGFTWKTEGSSEPVHCSLTANSTHKLYIRVHDMTPGLGEAILDEIYKETVKLYQPPPKAIKSNNINIYTCTKVPITAAQFIFQWTTNCVKEPRDIDTIYIDSEIKNRIILQLENFYKSKAMYKKYNVSWKRVHLFYGPPGSGKTSTVLAIASTFW